MSERDEAQARWAELTTPELEVDMVRIEEEAGKFERGIRRRNRLELGAGLIGAAVYAGYAWSFDHPVARAGALGVVVGVGVVVAVMRRWGREAPLPSADRATAEFLAAYRAALLRQARLTGWAPLWYVLPLLAPVAVFAVGLHAHLGRPGLPTGDLVGLAAFGAAVSALNVYTSRRMRRQAAALE